jgi:hypothetical protein
MVMPRARAEPALSERTANPTPMSGAGDTFDPAELVEDFRAPDLSVLYGGRRHGSGRERDQDGDLRLLWGRWASAGVERLEEQRELVLVRAHAAVREVLG